MNSSKLDITSRVAGPWLSSTISIETITQQNKNMLALEQLQSPTAKGAGKAESRITNTTAFPLF